MTDGRHEVILQLDKVSKTYVRKKDGQRQEVRAANQVSLTVKKQHVVALVGESGSGKSTLAKLITGVERADSGDILFSGKSLKSWSRGGLKAYRSHVQMVFQDPFAALNPLSTIDYVVKRPLSNYRQLRGAELQRAAEQLLDTVHLTPVAEFIKKYPFELSGGQLQRVVIARAIASKPELIVADEPVSMLDVSIRADILRLMASLREQQGVSFLYITHDLVSARMLADEIVVLYRGNVVEQGKADEVVKHPIHPYTQLLLRSIPNPWAMNSEPVHGEEEVRVRGSGMDAQNPHAGCVFAHRCPHVMPKCLEAAPQLVEAGDDRQVACYLHSDTRSSTSR